MKNYLLFDLDGTLTDPKVGICTCVQYALASFGIEEPDLDKLEPFIGPPLKDSFMQFYQMSDEQADAAIVKYRERFSDVGLFENTMYDGVPAMLQALTAKGMHLAVASSKPTVFVEKILEHFQIRKFFQVVVGSELDGRRVNKDEVVKEALQQLFGKQPIDKGKVYMIGDRKFDVEGARTMGVESIGVTYGYGSMQELRDAKADYIVQSVGELKDFLLRGADDAPKGLDLMRVFKTAYPIILFWLVKQAVMMLVQAAYVQLGGKLFGVPMVEFMEDGMVRATADGRALMSILGFAAGGGAVFKGTRIMVTRAAKESRLLHLKKEPIISYVYLILATLGAMLGLNLFLQLIGFTANSAAYQNTAQNQYAVNIMLGLILYGLAAPIAEEMLFRGIVYNGLKRSIQPKKAMLLAAAIFGIYHGNVVQALYGFAMGCLFIYAYEYFGDFKVPVALHMIVNLLSFLSSLRQIDFGTMGSWIVCLLSLMFALGGVAAMRSKKKVFGRG